MAAVLTLYADRPEAPLRASVQDQLQVRRLHDNGVPLRLVASSLLLGSFRRLMRAADLPWQPPIRSLAYFKPVIDALVEHPVPDLEFLRLKLRRISCEQSFLGDVQTKTL